MKDQYILWGIIITYMLFIFLKGVSKARKISDADDFLVAGRNVRWFFLAATMGATVIGGGASIGAIGKTYEWGILMLLVSTGWYFHFIFSGLVVAPKFREAELYTVAGYFGHRFGEGPRFLLLILSLLFSVFIVAAQMAAFGSVLSAILPDFADAARLLTWAIIIGGLMVVIYSTAGGLLAVIHTDVYQFVILFIGFIITLGFCIPDIIGSHNPSTGKFVPSRFSVVDLEDPVALRDKLQSQPDPVSEYVFNHLTFDVQDQIMKSQSSTVSDSLKYQLTKGLNSILDDPELYHQDRFKDSQLSVQTRDLIEANHQGIRALARRNLSLIQDHYASEITRNRMIPANFFKLDGGKGWLFLITTFLAFLLGETFAPGYATRYCVGNSIKETRIGITGIGVFLAFTFPVILFFIALYARIHFPDIDQQQALPMVIWQLNNPVIGGLIIGALLMAVMSSADSALNSATAIFVKDLFEHQLGWKDKGDGRILKLARICSALLGIAAIVIAVIWSDIIGILLFTYHIWAPAVILPVVIGSMTKERSKLLNRRIFITIIVATVATLIYRVTSFADKFDSAVLGVSVSILVYCVLLFKDRGYRLINMNHDKI